MIDPTIVVAIIGTLGTIISGATVYWHQKRQSQEALSTSFQQIAAELISDQVKSFASENDKLINRINELAKQERRNEQLIDKLREDVFSMRLRISSVAASLQSLAQLANSLVTLYDVKDAKDFKELLRNHQKSIDLIIDQLVREEGEVGDQ